MKENKMKKPIKIHDFLPLILLFVCIITLTTIHQWYAGYSLQGTMSDFMAFFFLIFGFFKILNWHGFAQAYAEYDILAQQSKVYAYAYPLIELALGTLYFLRLYPTATNLITLVVMLISGIGVAHELLQKKRTIYDAQLFFEKSIITLGWFSYCKDW